MVGLFHIWLKCRKCNKQTRKHNRFVIFIDVFHFGKIIISFWVKRKQIFGRKHLFKNVDDRNSACIGARVWQQTWKKEAQSNQYRCVNRIDKLNTQDTLICFQLISLFIVKILNKYSSFSSFLTYLILNLVIIYQNDTVFVLHF